MGILTGYFGIDEAALTNPTTQTRVDKLSERARGEKKDKKKAASEPDAEPENVVSNFSELSFYVPGAAAFMNGTYNLSNERVNLHGTLKTDARLSEDTNGIKLILLKPFDPLFKGKKAGAEVSVKTSGTYQNPQFRFLDSGLALNHDSLVRAKRLALVHILPGTIKICGQQHSPKGK
jgi:hypothetical protein